MKKIFKLNDLDCANCAAKMQAGIEKIDGVKNVTVNFITQRMVLEAEDAHFDEILDEAVKVCKRIEPDCEIVR